jgi:uncharacterized protein (TIGR03067 family)
MPFTLLLAAIVSSLALSLACNPGAADRLGDRLGALGWATKLWLSHPLALQAPTAPATRDDENRLRGTWEVVDWVDGTGVRLPVSLRSSRWAVFEAGRTTLLRPKRMDFRLDATCTPKRIDLRDGMGNLAGVYRLEGDLLSLCFNMLPDRERPARFRPQTRSLDFDHFLEGEHEDCLLILKRKRP